MPPLLQIALRFGGLAVVAVGGGNALIPALHATAVGATNWMSESSFVQAVALSQAAPGPNMLLLPLIGWHVAGVPGAVVALCAFLLPSSTIAILGSRLLARNESTPFVQSFRWALRPVTAGLMVSAAAVLIGTAARTWPDHTLPAARLELALFALTITVAWSSLRWGANPLVWLAAAALVGALV